jgi:hypothetical protein
MMKDIMNESMSYVRSVIDTILESQDNPDACREAFEEMNEEETRIFWDIIAPEEKLIVDNILTEDAA